MLLHDNGFVLLRFACGLTKQPMTALRAMLWLTERMKKYPAWLVISHQTLSMIIGVFLRALFVMNVDRYLATHYPLYHRTSVTFSPS